MKTETYSALRSANSLIGDRITTKDGKTCGKSSDFLFDEQEWTIRYVVADTGGLLSRHKVLLSPFVFENPEFGGLSQHMPTTLTREQIENSPPIDADAPISRRYEQELARHYNYPAYWTGATLWGYGPIPGYSAPPLKTPEEARFHEEKMEEIRESHLRSCKEVAGYGIVSAGDDLGKVADFIVETKPWRIRYLVVRTGSWFSRKKVVLPPDWISDISWEHRRAMVTDIGRDQIQGAPPFDPHTAINRDYEGNLYDYYGRPHYW